MNKKIILAILSFCLFIILTILIKMNVVGGFDTFIYNIVTSNMSNIITIYHKIITFFGSTLWIIILTLILFIIFMLLKKKIIAFLIAFVIIVSTIVNNVVKIIIRRSRPTVLALVTEKTFSFPSGHMMASVSLYGILIYLIIKSNIKRNYKILLCILLSILPVAVGISRIYLGAHFATDIIGASLLSLTLLLVEMYVIEKKNLLK